MNAHMQDITVPGTPFSMRTISRFLRQAFGLPSIHLRGEIVHEEDGLALTLRNLSTNKVPSIRIFQAGKVTGQLFEKGGAALLKLTTPSALAIHAYHKLSNSANKEEDYNQLMQLLEYCLDYPPATDDALAHNLWGGALLDLKRPKDAIGQYEKAIALDPRYSSAYNGLGIALLELKRPEEAIKQYEKAIAFDSKLANAYINWGNALMELKRPEEAIKQYEAAIALDPKPVFAYINWGDALTELKRPGEAIKQYEKAIALDPGNTYAYISLGNAFLDLKRPKEASRQYQEAIALDPKNTYAYAGWGNALLALKRVEEANEKYRIAKELENNDHD